MKLQNIQAIICLTFLTMPSEQLAMAEQLDPTPPLSQGDDELRVSDPSFDENCRAYFQDIAARQRWHIQRVIITKSAKWGLVWRADIDVAGLEYNTRMINRLVCWADRDRNGLSSNVAFGQQISPLSNN